MRYTYILGNEAISLVSLALTTCLTQWHYRRIPMSEIPSSVEDLDGYCHKLYQEKVEVLTPLHY